MENKLGMVGMGRVMNGRIMFSTVDGQGFSSSVTKKVEDVVEVALEEAVVEVEELDVPDFMKGYKSKRNITPVKEVVDNVIKVDFGGPKEVEVEVCAVEESLSVAGKFLNPFKRYFVDGETIKNILKGGK